MSAVESFVVNPSPARQSSSVIAAVPQVCWIPQLHPDRPEVEQFIRQGFATAYGAKVQQLMPFLLGVQHDGVWQAALGVRQGTASDLFIEQYLDTDIVSALAQHGWTTQRSDVVEIGNLYASSRSQLLLLFLGLISILQQRQIKMLVCCATPTVMSLLNRHGLMLRVLAPGDPERLQSSAQDWGTYYQHQPQVCALQVSDGWQVVAAQPKLLQLLAPNQAMLQQCSQTLATFAHS